MARSSQNEKLGFDMIDKIDLDVLRSSFQEVMNIEQQYVLVGNFSLDEVRSLVEQYIAPLPSASQKKQEQMEKNSLKVLLKSLFIWALRKLHVLR